MGGVCHDVGSKGGTHADERHADEGDTQPSVSQIRTPDGIRGCGDATRARGDAGTGAHTRMGDAGRSCDGDGGVVDVVSGIVGSAGAGAGGAAAVGGGVLADDVSVEADGVCVCFGGRGGVGGGMLWVMMYVCAFMLVSCLFHACFMEKKKSELLLRLPFLMYIHNVHTQ